MEAISTTVKVTLPKYLKSLPIPSSVEGLGKLSGDDVIALLPFFLVVSIIVYALMKLILPSRPPKPPQVNQDVKKDNPKVVNMVDIEDITSDKVAYCRCWKSKKFPLCDGAHNKHNELTGDNVGPLILKRSEPDSD